MMGQVIVTCGHEWLYHWSRLINVRSVKWFDVFEVKHISLYECVLYFLVCPTDEQFIVVIGLEREREREMFYTICKYDTFSVNPVEKYIGYFKFILSLEYITIETTTKHCYY